MVLSDTIVRGITRGAVHSSKPSSSVEPPINFNTNTGLGFPYAFAAITHEVMPYSLSFGETGGGSIHGPRGYVSCMAQAGVFTEGGPPAHLSSLSHLPSIRSPEIFYSFFILSSSSFISSRLAVHPKLP